MIAVLVAVNFALISSRFSVPVRPTVPYTLFRQQVEAGNVSELVTQGEAIRGVFRQPLAYPAGADSTLAIREFSTIQPTFADPTLEAALNEHGVIIGSRPLVE